MIINHPNIDENFNINITTINLIDLFINNIITWNISCSYYKFTNYIQAYNYNTILHASYLDALS